MALFVHGAWNGFEHSLREYVRFAAGITLSEVFSFAAPLRDLGLGSTIPAKETILAAILARPIGPTACDHHEKTGALSPFVPHDYRIDRYSQPV